MPTAVSSSKQNKRCTAACNALDFAIAVSQKDPSCSSHSLKDDLCKRDQMRYGNCNKPMGRSAPPGFPSKTTETPSH